MFGIGPSLLTGNHNGAVVAATGARSVHRAVALPHRTTGEERGPTGDTQAALALARQPRPGRMHLPGLSDPGMPRRGLQRWARPRWGAAAAAVCRPAVSGPDRHGMILIERRVVRGRRDISYYSGRPWAFEELGR